MWLNKFLCFLWSLQLVFAIVYFEVLGVTSPRLVTVGFHSRNGKVNIINTSLFSMVTKLQVDSCGGHVQFIAHDVKYSILVNVTAKPSSFGQIYGPNEKGAWEKFCAESFSAVAEVGIWRRSDSLFKRFSDGFRHGILGESTLVERMKFHSVALEFGEELLCYSETMYSDWLKLIILLETSNHNAFL